MAINRFYHPSVPVYTSQFVEDKTPWDQMMELNKEKISRADKTYQEMSQTDALISSLRPGLRSQNLSNEISDYYKGKLNNWINQFGKQSYSVPALRALTEIRNEYAADPNVKKVMQDREDSQLWQRWRSEPTYRAEADPNINKQTGQLYQLTKDSPYTPFSTPTPYASIEDEIAKEFSIIQEHQGNTPLSSQALLQDLKDKNGKVIAQVPVRLDTYTMGRDPSALENTTESLVTKILRGETPGAQYLKAILPADQWNENTIRKVVEQSRKPFEAVRQITQSSNLPESYLSSLKTPKTPDAGTYQLPAEKRIDTHNTIQIGGGKGDPSLLTRLTNSLTNITEKHNEIPDYYSAIQKNGIVDPQILFNLPNKVKDAQGNEISLKEGIWSDNNERRNYLLKQSLISNYDQTMALYNKYFQDKNGEILQLYSQGKNSDKLSNEVSQQRSLFNHIIDQYNKDILPNDSMFLNENNSLAAKYVIEESGKANLPGFPWNSEADFLDSDPKNWSQSQKLWVRRNQVQYINEQMKKPVTPEVSPLDPKTTTWLNDIYGGSVNENNLLQSTKNPTAILLGQKFIDPKDPTKDWTDKDKTNLVENARKNKEVFRINGMIKGDTSQFGPGWLSITIGKNNYYVRGPKEMQEADKFKYNLLSYNLPSNMGIGNIFAVENINPEQWDQYIPIRDRWDENKPTPNDIYMQTRFNPENNNIELLAYQGDPLANKDNKIDSPVSEDNPKGYYTFTMAGPGYVPAEQWARYQIAQVYWQMIFNKTNDQNTKNTARKYFQLVNQKYRQLYDQNKANP